MRTNYHTHSHFCDGVGSPREYVLSAIERGFKSLGFSGHAPLEGEDEWTMKTEDVEPYINEINRLKAEFKDEINIYLGMEVDYIPGKKRFKKYNNLDYIIGALHMLWSEKEGKFYSVDSTIEECRYQIEEVYGSSEAYVRAFYKGVREMIEEDGFNILAHFDLLKKFNRGEKFFTEEEPWYREEVFKTLDLLKGKDIIVEVNTGAVAKGYREVPYPSLWILKECFKRGIKICLNSDCHTPNKLDYFYTDSLKMIRESGYTVLHYPFETIEIGDIDG